MIAPQPDLTARAVLRRASGRVISPPVRAPPERPGAGRLRRGASRPPGYGDDPWWVRQQHQPRDHGRPAAGARSSTWWTRSAMGPRSSRSSGSPRSSPRSCRCRSAVA
ncbi:hypothetical protein SM007_38185 [Streptomyces avermitilis]|nr:hypothetical protein SM007_38185 [Streptomyces avermitilis]